MRVDNRVESHHMPFEVFLGRPPPRATQKSPCKRSAKLVWDDKKADEIKMHLETQRFIEQFDEPINDAEELCTQAFSLSARCLKREIGFVN